MCGKEEASYQTNQFFPDMGFDTRGALAIDVHYSYVEKSRLHITVISYLLNYFRFVYIVLIRTDLLGKEPHWQ